MPYIKTRTTTKWERERIEQAGKGSSSCMWHVARRSVDLRLKRATTTSPTSPTPSLPIPFSASFCAQLIILINRTGAPQVVVEPYVMRAHLLSHFPTVPAPATPSWANVTVTQVVPVRRPGQFACPLSISLDMLPDQQDQQIACASVSHCSNATQHSGACRLPSDLKPS